MRFSRLPREGRVQGLRNHVWIYALAGMTSNMRGVSDTLLCGAVLSNATEAELDMHGREAANCNRFSVPLLEYWL
jgi:hypothetical protein